MSLRPDRNQNTLRKKNNGEKEKLRIEREIEKRKRLGKNVPKMSASPMASIVDEIKTAWGRV